jgi:hypothetical protein
MLALLCAEGESQQICTVPDSKLQEAQQAFSEVTKVFRTPRCINCHGAVNPFVKNTIHAGGRLETFSYANHDFDFEKTFAQCQACHGAFPDWHVPNGGAFFTDKTDAELCKQMKESNGQEGGFIGHVENDHGGTQFIAVAFAGTRGLNEMGQQMAQNYPEPPPPDITRANLISSARRWVEILTPYHAATGDNDCGCVPQRYVLRIELQGTQAISLPGSDQINYEWQAQPTDFPLELGEGGTFTSSGTLVLAAREVATLPAQNVTCTVKGTMDGETKLSGVLKEEQVSVQPGPLGLGPAFENQLQLSGKLTWLRGTVNGTNTCTTKQGRTIVSTAKNAPQINQPPELAFKVPAQVGPAQKVNLALPPGATVTMTIQIIDKGIHSEP